MALANVLQHGGADTRRERAMVLGKGIFGSLFAAESHMVRDSRDNSTTSKGPDNARSEVSFDNTEDSYGSTIGRGNTKVHHGSTDGCGFH